MKNKNFFNIFTLTLCVVLLCLMLVFVYLAGREVSQSDSLKVTDKLECVILSVGDGSCAVFKCDGKAFMIDLGPSDCREHVEKVLKECDIAKLDALIISHPHSDHYGAFKALKDVYVEKVYISPCESEKSFYLDCLDFFKGKGSLIEQAPIGESINVGNVNLLFMGPLGEYESINDMSLVVKINYKNVSVLMPGDMASEECDDIISSGNELKADVFVCAHHGSNADGANSYLLLREIIPDYAIISSAGAKSDYGYPHEEVLSRLNDLGTEIYRTDLYGDISFYTDGNEIYFN